VTDEKERDTVSGRDENLKRLEDEIGAIRPAHDESITKVDSALDHLAAATADLQEVRRIERLNAGGR